MGAALTLICVASSATFSRRALPVEEHVYIDWERPGMKLFLRHIAPAKQVRSKEGRVVIILHGAVVPSAGNAAFVLGGRSWMSDLAGNGFDVWALDFAGFGNSSRYPEMDAPAAANPPLGQAEECSRQVSLAVRYIKNRQRVKRVSIIGDSGGSLVAGVFATREPEVLDRLVLFGPIAPQLGKEETPNRTANGAAHFLITPDELLQQFASVPAGEKPVFDRKYFEEVWSPLLLNSNPTSRERNPPSVKVPNGRLADLAEIAAGHFPYDLQAYALPPW